MELSWSLLSGEYPPRAGGVADYTQRLARALAATGDAVEVWAPGELERDPTVRVRSLPDLGPRGLAHLRAGLEPRARLLVQYAPHALGWKGLNLPLCAWLGRTGRRPWVMFHEVAFPRAPGAPWREQLLARGQALMARQVAHGAARTFVSTASWTPLLRQLAPDAPAPGWLPVFSNLPEQIASEDLERTRRALPPGTLIGHFGTYGAWFEARLAEVLPALLRADRARAALLLGRGAEGAAARLLDRRPELRGSVLAREGDPTLLAAHLAACDVLVQPYMDGPTTRRGTLMAGMALGKAVVSNDGHLTEPFLRAQRCLRIAAEPADMVAEAERLLTDMDARRALGERAAQVYQAELSLRRTVERLRAEALCG